MKRLSDVHTMGIESLTDDDCWYVARGREGFRPQKLKPKY